MVIADILDDEGKQLAAELGEQAVYQHLDVGDEDGWAAAVDRATTEFGAPNVLVNNAGILHFSRAGQDDAGRLRARDPGEPDRGVSRDAFGR